MAEVLTNQFNLQDRYNCVICQDNDDKPYVNHTNISKKGYEHDGFHYSCLTDWLSRNNNCPICFVDINQVVSIHTLAKIAMNGIALTLKYTYNSQIVMALTATTAAALMAGQTDAARTLLNTIGLVYFFTSIFGGIRSTLTYGELKAKEEMAYNARATGRIATIATLAILYLKPDTKDLYMQAVGAFSILYKAAGSGAVANIRQLPYPISLFSATTGYAVASTTKQFFASYNPYLEVGLAAVVGGVAIAATGSVLYKGYRSYNKKGFTPF